MQIVIPMSGFGERFRRAGYKVPKPLIEIEGKPIIGHVIDLFSSSDTFIFICNQSHLDTAEFHMQDILMKHCPNGKVIGIPPHKLGPVHALLSVSDEIDLSLPTVVNYCDFACYWDWADFCDFTRTTKCVGAIPAYKGFHPHTLGTTNYAYMKEQNGWVLDIQEKQPYTDNRMEEYASSGTYYFDSGKRMLDACQAVVDQDLNVNGEYYVSLAYKPLLADSQPIAVYGLQHFMQWGTPEDLSEYEMWSNAFHSMLDDTPKYSEAGSIIVPMAGLGSRFAKEGYTNTKPLIEVSGAPMVIQAVNDLPNAATHSFLLRQDMQEADKVEQILDEAYRNVTISRVSEVTDGQATSAMLALQALEQQSAIAGPITFGACDNGAIFSKTAWQNAMQDDSVDVWVWGVSGYANAVRHPQMYGWIDANASGKINQISVKTPLKSPETDPIVLGTFTFKRSDDFKRCYASMRAREAMINGEYYLDTLINDAITLGLTCKVFLVDFYLGWGTPNDLKTFEYWQSCFSKWSGHPYRLGADARIPKNALRGLEILYQTTKPPRPSMQHMTESSDGKFK